MGKIAVLPDILINQIAAGEVVERPASIVKELVENSLDAGATQIFIEIEQGGAKLISIRDDGQGMSQDDAILACARHATSKIKTMNDLTEIRSFGFRGEALASIASISQLTLKTRTHDTDHGYEIEVHGGKIISQKSIAAPSGTEVLVQNIFFNTPARRKFLKSESVEAAHIASTVSHMALAYPRVRFELIHNGKKILSVPAMSSDVERMSAILGSTFVSQSVPVQFTTPSLTITGFVSTPGNAAATKKHQYIFVNGRDIGDAMIARAVKDAFGSRLPPRMYPSFIITITMEPRDVDVNVHPRKLTVKFADQNNMYRCIRQAITQALEQFQAHLFSVPGAAGNEYQNPSNFLPGDTGKNLSLKNDSITDRGVAQEASLDLSSTASEFPFKILGQMADSYILIFKEDGLSIVDQHAAHERILYERFRNRSETREIVSQPLLVPLSVECTPTQLVFLQAAMEFLSSIGFQIDFWSGSTVTIQACPLELAKENLSTVFKKFLDEVVDSDSGGGSTTSKGKILPEKILKSLACKAAIKFGMPIGAVEQKQLLIDLMRTQNNSTCPHGRPTQVVITFDELERRFYRN